MTNRIWDISPPVQDGTPVFPGDTPYRQQRLAHATRDLPPRVLVRTYDSAPVELIALPLKLMSADTSPVRAILRALP